MDEKFERLLLELKSRVEELNDIVKNFDKSEINLNKEKLRTLEKSINDLYDKGLSNLTTELQRERTKIEESMNDYLNAEVELLALKRKLSDLLDLILVDDKPGRKRRRRGELTPQDAYIIPILESLIESGGKGRAGDILDMVEQKMKGILKDVDYELLPSGQDIRWKNHAKWARSTIINEGLLKSDSLHGIWEISEEGREYYELNKELKNESDN
jgi:cellulose biosynthesis protein BcsQ